MKKVIKLTENDLERIVRRTIEEQSGQSTGQTPAQTPAQPTKQGTITIQLSVPQLPNINKQDLETYFKSPEFQKLLLNKFKERTNENDLSRIVRRVIKEQDENEFYGMGVKEPYGAKNSKGEPTGKRMVDYLQSDDDYRETDVDFFRDNDGAWEELTSKYPGIDQWWGKGGKEAYSQWVKEYGPLAVWKRNPRK